MGEIFYAFFNTKTHERLSNYGVANWQDIVLPNNFSREQIMGIGNAFALPDAKNYFSGSEKMPTAADYLRLAMSGKYEATAPELAELLYIRNKIALTAAEQAARKFQAA